MLLHFKYLNYIQLNQKEQKIKEIKSEASKKIVYEKEKLIKSVEMEMNIMKKCIYKISFQRVLDRLEMYTLFVYNLDMYYMHIAYCPYIYGGIIISIFHISDSFLFKKIYNTSTFEFKFKFLYGKEYTN